jgi:TonB family protein
MSFARKCVAVAAFVLPCGTCFAQTSGDTPSVVSAAFVDMSSCERPKYPVDSLARKASGTTVLRYVVGADRVLRDVHVERSSGWQSLDDAALEAFSRCKGVPALVNGVPVTSYGRLNYNWRPSNQGPLEFDTARDGCKPAYPIEAVRRELQGTTRLRFSITETGSLVKVEVVQSSGSDLLDAAAISGLATCRFKPRQDARGLPVPDSFHVEYVWKLQ